MKKSIFCIALAVMLLLVAVPAYADGVANETFSAKKCENKFYTTRSITRPDNTSWDSQLMLVISKLESTGSKNVIITPVNKYKVVMGDDDTFTSTGNYYLKITSNYKNIRLLVENNNGGINIVIKGSWVGSYT